MKERWRLIDDSPLPGGWNMSVDAALLEEAERNPSAPPTLRLYGWDRPTLSAGYAQDIARDLDLDYLEKNDIPVTRRPTGGRAVLHHDEVTYAVIVPERSRLYGSLREIYNRVAVVIREALEKLGVEMDPWSGEGGVCSTGCCFATKTRHEITIKGRKVVGGAQRRLKRCALQHGSIMLSQDVDTLLSCIRWPDPGKREAVRPLIGGVNDCSGTRIDGRSLRRCVAKTLELMYDIELARGGLTRAERELAMAKTADVMKTVEAAL